MLTFSWSPVLPNCSSIAYRITSENCGECPTLTYDTSVNCTIIVNQTNAALDQLCTFSVVSDNSIGNASTSITANLKGNDIIIYSPLLSSIYNIDILIQSQVCLAPRV